MLLRDVLFCIAARLMATRRVRETEFPERGHRQHFDCGQPTTKSSIHHCRKTNLDQAAPQNWFTAAVLENSFFEATIRKS